MEDKPEQYILIMETNPNIDLALKKRFMVKMQSCLPFKYVEKEDIKRHVIDGEFLILDIKEWNEKFAKYQITPLEVSEEVLTRDNAE